MPRNTSPDQPSAEEQVTGLIAKLEPQQRKLMQSVRKLLRKRFPTANELVYDYAKNLVISYSPTENGIDGIVALSADVDGIRFVFNHGKSLPDPHKILLGNASMIRYIQLDKLSVLSRPEVESLLVAAESKLKIPLSSTGQGRLIIKSSKPRPKSGESKSKRPNKV